MSKQSVKAFKNTMEEKQIKFWIHSPSTDPEITPLSLYHYTSDYSKNQIVNEEKGSVNFQLSKASGFLDKNEGIYILEPYFHACGYLYDKNIIDYDFYKLLRTVKVSNIRRGLKSIWILCLTAEGYSKFMKERYAPNDGWLIELSMNAFDELVSEFNDDVDNYPNYIYMAEIRYSYHEMKENIQDFIIEIFKCYKSDSCTSKKTKNNLVIRTIESYLCRYNFCYKSSAYKEEKEIRLICNIKKQFDRWSSRDNHRMQLYFEKGILNLCFEQGCYRQSMQQLDVYNSIELNKLCTTSTEIRETVKKRSQEFESEN